MTSEAFRSLALALPGAAESAHMRHPDFRVGGKVFATLDYPAQGWAMVKLAPEEQQLYLAKAPKVFGPASGAWGRGGSTLIQLAAARPALVRAALMSAFRHLAASRKRP
jgi:hypothetical protein